MQADKIDINFMVYTYFAVCDNVPGNGGSTIHSLATFLIALGLTGVAMAVLFWCVEMDGLCVSELDLTESTWYSYLKVVDISIQVVA